MKNKRINGVFRLRRIPIVCLESTPYLYYNWKQRSCNVSRLRWIQIIRLIGVLIMTLVILFTLSHCITPVPMPDPEPESELETDQKKIQSDSTKGEEHKIVAKRSGKFSPKGAAGIAKMYAKSGNPGGRVLKAAAKMVDEKEVILGGCWTYVNEVYNRAGFPKEKRETLYKVEKEGPYVDPALILPGDWIMYRNLPYNEIGHSAIFVEWINFERRSALTIEYVGGNRKIPGRYREADIYKTFGLMRGKD